MKKMTFRFLLLSLGFFCLVSNFAIAQIVEMPGSTITGNVYSSAVSAGSIVVFTKPGGTNTDVRLATYNIEESGTVKLTDYEDFGNCGNPKITKLTSTRAILAMRNVNQNHEVRVYDFNASGNLAKKSWWAGTGGGAVNPRTQDVLRMSNTAFVSVSIDGVTFRVYSFTVNTAGAIAFKDDDTHNLEGDVVSLARMSSTRFILSVRTTGNIMKVICYDVNESTGQLTRRGEYQWGNETSRISMVAFGGNKLACFLNNSLNYLHTTTLEVTAAGAFNLIQSNRHIYMPGTNTLYELKTIDAQYDSGPGKIHLCAISTSNKLFIIPFSFTNAGILTIAPTGQYTSTTTYTHTSASAATNLVITASRRTDGKYHMQGFKWGN